MIEYRVVRDYPDAPERVWRALTDPAIVPLWTSTGKGGKPVGFAAVVGMRFQLVGKPTGLRGFFMAKLLGSVRKKMLHVGLPAALRSIDGGARG